MDLIVEERSNKPSTLTACFTSLWNSFESNHFHTFQNSKMEFNELKKAKNLVY